MGKDIDIIEKEFDSYLTKAIIGASKNALKKQMKFNNEKTIIDDEDYCAALQGGSAFNNPFIVVEDVDLKIDVKIALSCLQENEQAAINLLINKHLTKDEAAKTLKVHRNTILNRQKSAIEKLKKYFDRRG